MAQISHPSVRSRRLKYCVFGFTAVTSAATTFFFYYLYFYTQKKFGFGQTQNLLLAAGIGYIYCVSSFFAGQFAQRFGYFFSIRFGLCTMIFAMSVASQMNHLWMMLPFVALANIGMSFCWPALEALMSEGEAPARLQSLVGLYNISWAGAAAVAYFFGGAVLQRLGSQCLFFVPVAIFVGLLVFLSWFEKQIGEQPTAPPGIVQSAHVMAEVHRSPIPARVFLTMSWLANPMAYLVLNTVVSTIPSLAEHFHFQPMLAGFVCSAWLFSRAAAFLFLRMWPKWHYRFRFLGFGYVAMVLSFASMLIIPNVWSLIVSQLVLGFGLGLMYYSSLFYSMDVGDTKSEHGGFHEAAIGLGSGTGPAIAAVSRTLFQGTPGSGALGVCVLLVFGFCGLIWLRFRPTNR